MVEAKNFICCNNNILQSFCKSTDILATCVLSRLPYKNQFIQIIWKKTQRFMKITRRYEKMKI